MIKVVDLKKSYGKTRALKSISFEVEKGSVFGFIGRNGAGKTTTMNILTGLMRFDKGKIFLHFVHITYVKHLLFYLNRCLLIQPELSTGLFVMFLNTDK